MQTPACKKSADSNLLEEGDADLVIAPQKSADLPSLAECFFDRSSMLLWLYRGVYGAFALAIGLALFPFVVGASHWVLSVVWLLLLCILCFWLAHSYRRQYLAIPAGSLSYTCGGSGGAGWQLTLAGKTYRCQLCREVLCWPWLIILPFEEVESRQRRPLILASDALSAADQARLRTWLRACLKPKS